jgi:hypothetical protein
MSFNATRLGKGLFAAMTALTHNAKRIRMWDSAPIQVVAEVVDTDANDKHMADVLEQVCKLTRRSIVPKPRKG